MNKAKIAIIGGGSTGLFLASLLSSHNFQVTIFEKNNRLGKKISVSGNGKCNFTNISNYENKYNNDFAYKIIKKYSVEETLRRFKTLGLIYKSDDEGRCYPVSESSASVLDCLKLSLNEVNILLEEEVKEIQIIANKYLIICRNKKEEFDYVICCSGSIASVLGSEKSYNYLKSLDIEMAELKPALVPLRVEEDTNDLKGTRIKCTVQLFNGLDILIHSEKGEVIFKEDALSGIVIFNISSIINRNGFSRYKIVLDLSCGLSEEEFIEYVENRGTSAPKNLLKGYLNDKVAAYILKPYLNYNELKLINIQKIYQRISKMAFNVKGLYSFLDSQVCSGGINLSEINENLELKKHPNMYIGGELLDIDGLCGGYNLQFAWSSAGVIYKDIIKKVGEKGAK